LNGFFKKSVKFVQIRVVCRSGANIAEFQADVNKFGSFQKKYLLTPAFRLGK
jgi:hypothetical protein